MRRTVALFLAVSIVACGDGTTEPPIPDPPRATTLTLTPATVELTALGATVQLSAQVLDQYGGSVAGATVSWSSSDASVARVDEGGLVTAVGNGAATVTAGSGSASAAAEVAVEQAVAGVEVSPSTTTLASLGDTVRLAAEASDANGHPVAGAEFTWSSSDASVARVDEGGLVTAVGNGAATVTATVGSGEWGFATVTVAVRGDPISIPDPNLRTLIEHYLHKRPDSPIYEGEMATLRSLIATREIYKSGGVADLEGIQYAKNLLELDLDANYWDAARHRWFNLNDLSDLSPLAGLTKLQILDLSGSNDSITDLSPLSGLADLRKLWLWNARVQNLQPLAGLTELESLDLGSNDHLSDLSPLSGLTNLRQLYVYNSSISDIAPLANLTNLQDLNAGDNYIDDIAPVAALTNLVFLDLSYNNLSDLSPLKDLQKLVSLEISGCSDWAQRVACRTPPDLTHLSGLNDLEFLTLSQNSLRDLTPLSHLTNLQRLWLRDNNISNLTPLSGMTQLGELDLSQNEISDLAPLVANTGLGSQDVIDVRHNPLNAASVSTHIPTLQARGAEVSFDEVIVVNEPLIFNDNVFVLPVEEDLRASDLPLHEYSKRVYERFEDGFDFLMFVSNLDFSEGVGSANYVGTYMDVRNQVRGIGFSTFSNDDYGSAAVLQGVMHFPYYFAIANGPTLHEIMHRWGNGIVDGSYGVHWGFSSANGLLGGFDIADLVEVGDGQYTAGDFSPLGLALNAQPYSPIELYLAGLATPDEVPDLWVAEDGKTLLDEDGIQVVAANGYPIFTATKTRTYTIEDIIAEHGPRAPDASSAQRAFRAVAVLLVNDQRQPTRETLETVSANVAWFSHPEDDEFAGYNFFEGTLGRATIKMDELSDVERVSGSDVSILGHAPVRIPWVEVGGELGGAIGSPGRIWVHVDGTGRSRFRRQ